MFDKERNFNSFFFRYIKKLYQIYKTTLFE